MDKTAPLSSGHIEAKSPSGLLWMIALIFLGMISLPLSLVYSNHYSRAEPQWVPVALHSILQADYSADPRANRIPAVKIDLIKEALADQAGDGRAQGFEEVQEGLKTPVPTVGSGLPLATATPMAPSDTPLAWTAAPTQSHPTPTRSHPTQTATLSPTATHTFLPPTRTPLPTKEPVRTSKPAKEPEPTDTPRPTQKPTEPRPTQPPPTNPPTKPPPPDPYPPPPPPPKPTDPYP